MSYRGRTIDERLEDAERELNTPEARHKRDLDAKQAVWDENGVPVKPAKPTSEQLICYYSAMAKYCEGQDRLREEQESKERTEEKSANGKKSGKGEKAGSARGSFTKKKGLKMKPVNTGAGRTEDELVEMSDDPVVKNYAANHRDRQWDGSMTVDEPAFPPLPQRTRDREEIRRELKRWDRTNHQAGKILPDGSGIDTQEFAEFQFCVKPDTEQLQRDVEDFGGWIAIGPRGSKVRLTHIGQREGSRLLAEEGRRKGREGE